MYLKNNLNLFFFETKINVEIIEESVDILVELSPDNDVDKELLKMLKKNKL